MKILIFLFYASIYNNKRLTPKRNADTQALFEISVVLMSLSAGIVFSAINMIKLWPWLMENWPYEYGHIHSRNLFAPTGILAIILWFTIHNLLKNHLSKESTKNEIGARFNNRIGNLKAEKFTYVTPILVPFNIISSVFFAAGYWLLFSSCMLVWVGLELWVRKTFYWNTSQK